MSTPSTIIETAVFHQILQPAPQREIPSTIIDAASIHQATAIGYFAAALEAIAQAE